ncbi:MAG: hypothetical protein ABJA81_05655 [Nocardioidaceae bacterium]
MSRSMRTRSWLGLTVAVTGALMATLLPGSLDMATAKPPSKPGTVTGLALSASLAGTTYTVDATWNPATNATAYRVTMTSATGTVLDQAKVTTASFSGTTTLPAGSNVNVQVVPFNGKRRGRTTSKSILLPDLTAPVASYTVTPQNSSDGNVTIQLSSISDDVSQASSITQQIDWADGTPTTSGDGTVTSFPHGYGATKAIYYPVVTVGDLAGNTRTYQLTAVVADTTAPTGSFSVAPATAWASWTDVTVTVVAIDDDLSDPDKLTRSLDWGDGTTEAWTTGPTASHRYSTSGSFTPAVTIVDEAGNVAGPLATSAVDVTVDSVAPRLRLILPKLHKHSVSSWTTLKGRARDAGTGVRKVRVRAIEKRGSVWYAYHPAGHSWVRAGKTPTAAWSKSKRAKLSTSLTHRWSVRLYHLKKGLLVYKVSAVDNVHNATAWKEHKQLLTRR